MKKEEKDKAISLITEAQNNIMDLSRLLEGKAPEHLARSIDSAFVQLSDIQLLMKNLLKTG